MMILRPVTRADAAALEPADAAEDASVLERRVAARKSAATNALIISPELSLPMACLVRDVSTTGARITLVASSENLLGGRAKIPTRFVLDMRLDRMVVECAIAWRSGAAVGVRFVSKPRSYVRTGKS
jgi:hypothetical protein